MPVENLARDEVVTARPDTPVTELASTMHEQSVGSVVITEGNSPVGIATDRDLAVRLIAQGSIPEEHTAADVMSTDVRTVTPDAGFYEVAQTMSEHGIRRLPVCNENDELTGIITIDDISELLADEQQHLASVIRAQRPEY